MLTWKWRKSGADLPSVCEMLLRGEFQFLLFLPWQQVEVNYLVFEDFDHYELDVEAFLEFFWGRGL